jgi:pSer/pThr/pTyr-binding forkhead associated (FHA) protein
VITVQSGQRTTTTEQTFAPSPPAQGSAPGPGAAPGLNGAPAQAVFARVSYTDKSGMHRYDLVRDSTSIGRGGIAYPVDIRIASSEDVSREHARIRRDPRTGACFLIDLSSLGTTLNGRHVPRGFDEVDGAKRENGAESELRDRARIGLAETVFLDFEKVG